MADYPMRFSHQYSSASVLEVAWGVTQTWSQSRQWWKLEISFERKHEFIGSHKLFNAYQKVLGSDILYPFGGPPHLGSHRLSIQGCTPDQVLRVETGGRKRMRSSLSDLAENRKLWE
jgi:hypothetical protein